MFRTYLRIKISELCKWLYFIFWNAINSNSNSHLEIYSFEKAYHSIAQKHNPPKIHLRKIFKKLSMHKIVREGEQLSLPDKDIISICYEESSDQLFRS